MHLYFEIRGFIGIFKRLIHIVCQSFFVRNENDIKEVGYSYIVRKMEVAVWIEMCG